MSEEVFSLMVKQARRKLPEYPHGGAYANGIDWAAGRIAELEQQLATSIAYGKEQKRKRLADRAENERLRAGIRECNRYCPALDALEQQEVKDAGLSH